MKVFIGDLLEKVQQEKENCPRCHGTGIEVCEIGPACDRTYEQECPHAIMHGDVYPRLPASWDSWCWYGNLRADTVIGQTFKIDGNYAIEDPTCSIRAIGESIGVSGTPQEIFEAYKARYASK